MDKSHRGAVWLLHALGLKIRGSHLECGISNKCLNIFEWLEVVKRKKLWSSFLPCCPVNRQYVWKKAQIKKYTFEYFRMSTNIETLYGNCSWYMIYGDRKNTHQIESIKQNLVKWSLYFSKLFWLEIFCNSLSCNFHGYHETITLVIIDAKSFWHLFSISYLELLIHFIFHRWKKLGWQVICIPTIIDKIF